MEKFEQVVGDMSSCDFQSFEAGLDDVSAEDGDAMCHTVTAIEKHGGVHTLSEEGHQCLHTVLDPIDLEFFEHDFHHADLIGHWVHNRFRYED